MIKIEPKTIVRVSIGTVFQLTPILLIMFMVILPSLELLTDETSEATQELVEQAVESYIKDMNTSADNIFGLIIVWVLITMGGIYFSLMYVSYIGGKVADKICNVLLKEKKHDEV